MVFRYKAIDINDEDKEGTIETVNIDVAISALQRRGLIIVSIVSEDDVPVWERSLTMFQRVSNKEVVILSRQISTLFLAQVSALRVFRLIAAENENETLRKKLNEMADDIQGGMSLANSMAKHSDVFSDFYINMIRAGEESGNLSKTFLYLADYLDRAYELTSKTKNALIYPAFVITTFIIVMILMLVVVIPKLSAILLETDQEIPVYTKVVIGASNYLLDYGVLIFAAVVTMGFLLWRSTYTAIGRQFLARIKLAIPYIGELYRKLYLSRIADNMNTMLSSGIPVVRSVEITANIVGSEIYADALRDVADDVRGGSALSDALAKHEEIPGIMIQMVKVGEETGEVGGILETLATFYKREVDNAVDTMVGMIEPLMIVLLGLGVGGLLASILLPIYNITATI